MRTINFSSHFNFGKGIDSIAETACGQAVDIDKAKPIQGAAGQEVQFSLEMLESQHRFERALGISATASVKAGLTAFAGGSVDAKFEFAQNHTFSAYSLNILARVYVKNPVLMLQNPQLSKQASDLYERDPDAFRERYGDSFVSGLHTGGEFFGLIVVETRDETSRKQIQSNLTSKGAFGAWRGSFGLDVGSTTEAFTGSKDISVFIIRSGGSGELESDPEGMIRLAKEFPKAVEATGDGKGWPYRVDLTEYRFLDLPPPPNPFDLEAKRELLADLGRKRSDALSLKKEIQYIRSNADEFVGLTPEVHDSLDNADAKLNEALDRIYKQASMCFNNYRDCSFEKASIVVPRVELPERISPNAIDVVSLLGLRLSIIRKIKSRSVRSYDEYRREYENEYEEGTQGVSPSRAQYDFIRDARLNFERADGRDASIGMAFSMWVVDQKPKSGQVSPNQDVLLTLKFGRQRPP